MAQTPEGKVKDKARDLYKKYGAVYDRNAINGMGQNGRPDDLVCRNDGHFGAIEAKKENVFKVTALQRIWLNKCAAAGGSSMVINLTNLSLLEQWLSMPGWRVTAKFGEGKQEDTCTHHEATREGWPPVTIKNPGG
ncbi:hypothetical protein [Pseudomonas mediterranea]|uniref:hypothetical protein n=1 Tax=Pseudomonas mediterranea TaxID=183795 RepID=UPI0006D8A9DD|nr:hypothetical protein [Pseudomonas mediterranea]